VRQVNYSPDAHTLEIGALYRLISKKMSLRAVRVFWSEQIEDLFPYEFDYLRTGEEFVLIDYPVNAVTQEDELLPSTQGVFWKVLHPERGIGWMDADGYGFVYVFEKVVC